MTNQEEIQNAIEWIEGLRNGWNDEDNIKYCNMAIKTLEQTRWIPVSEGLPKSCGMYIVSRKIHNRQNGSIFISDASWFDGAKTWHNDNRINHKRKYFSDVVAWMPLPEPYKAESEEV